MLSNIENCLNTSLVIMLLSSKFQFSTSFHPQTGVDRNGECLIGVVLETLVSANQRDWAKLLDTS